MKKILFTTALFAVFFTTIAFCQGNNPVITGATSRLKTLLTDHVTEKAYLHFDRPYACYVAGDIIYFKAYVTKGERHELTNISGMLHVDLINNNNVLLQSNLVQLTNGVGWGDLSLPDTLQKGSYRVRAWTEWMRNEKNPNYFTQYISVGSANSVLKNSEPASMSGEASVQFFAEGGNLVNRVPSRVAFKAIGRDGLGVGLKGVVVDDKNNEVAQLISTHLGMGVFDFMPEQGKKYTARVTFADGSKKTVDLPVAEDKGITLSVNTADPAKISIEVKANPAYYKENLNKELNLLIYSAGTMRTVTTKLDNAVLGLDLPANSFSSGVLTVTLLSGAGDPLNERMVFIQNPDLLNLSVGSNKAVYTNHENVQLKLSAKNKESSGVTGSFSVSVVDESKITVDDNSENSILSYLLLTSDVKGYVEKPNYYFTNVSKESRANLDALMLTQGFRRFVWKELLNNSSSESLTYKPEQYLDITGKLTAKNGEPIPNASLILLPLGQTAATDAQGRFRFEKINFQNGTRFFVKVQSSTDKNSPALTLDKSNHPAPDISDESIPGAKYNANADILASLQDNQKQGILTASDASTTTLLQNSNSMRSIKNKNDYRSTKLGGNAGNADQVIKADQILSGTSLSIELKGVARGIDFQNGIPYLQNSATIGAGGGSSPMLILVDGAETNNIDDVTPSIVDNIEILKGPNAAIYGMRGAAGVMVITTKQSGTQVITKELTPGIFSVTPTGFYKAREFYSPVYDAVQPANNLPDNRVTIFWKPDITTDASGNASISFYNANSAGTYRVEVQGIDGNGNLGRVVYRYKIQ